MAVELKVSVLSSGEIVLDGKPVPAAEFEAAMLRKRQECPDCTVLYYREDANGQAPPESLQVIKVLLKHRLTVSLCSQPDFSDFVDRFGQSRPRAELPQLTDVFRPHLPDVFPDADVEAVVERARSLACHDGEKRGLVVVRPDRGVVVIPQKGALTTDGSGIAVIANTAITLRDPDGEISNEDLTRAIPFLTHLEALFRNGHAVWIFEGHRDALAAACRGAGSLLVDGALLPFLDPDWREVCQRALAGGTIQIYNRETNEFSEVHIGSGGAKRQASS